MIKISSTPEAGALKTIELGEGIVLEMIFIPAGEFIMGSPIS